MPSDEPSQHASEAKTDSNPPTLPIMQPVSLQPFTSIRLNDILPTEIVARRFPVTIDNPSMQMNVQFNIVEINIDPESLQAQVTLEVKIEPSEEPHFFEMYFKLVALFSYGSEHTQEMVGQFLQQGSLSLMIPFARELILNLSTRLHMPPIVLSLIQLAPPSTPETK